MVRRSAEPGGTRQRTPAGDTNATGASSPTTVAQHEGSSAPAAPHAMCAQLTWVSTAWFSSRADRVAARRSVRPPPGSDGGLSVGARSGRPASQGVFPAAGAVFPAGAGRALSRRPRWPEVTLPAPYGLTPRRPDPGPGWSRDASRDLGGSPALLCTELNGADLGLRSRSHAAPARPATARARPAASVRSAPMPAPRENHSNWSKNLPRPHKPTPAAITTPLRPARRTSRGPSPTSTPKTTRSSADWNSGTGTRLPTSPAYESPYQAVVGGPPPPTSNWQASNRPTVQVAHVQPSRRGRLSGHRWRLQPPGTARTKMGPPGHAAARPVTTAGPAPGAAAVDARPKRRRRKALVTTDTEEKAMARAAKIGGMIPKAARGTRTRL